MSYVIRTKFDGFSPDGSRRFNKGGGGKTYTPTQNAEAAAAERQKNVQAAQDTVNGYFTPKADGDPFSEGWYTNQRKAYADYYLPDLEKQYKNARQQLEMNLAQTNPYGSSTNIASMQRLEDEYQKQYASMNQNADNFTADLRTQIADARTKAMSGAGDVSLATTAQQAADAASSAASVPAFSPLGQLFANMVQPTMTGLSGQIVNNGTTSGSSNTGGVTNYNTGTGSKNVSWVGKKI